MSPNEVAVGQKLSEMKAIWLDASQSTVMSPADNKPTQRVNSSIL